ncbi:hypothetical protein CDD82_7564 [Ophiocordyceps australis]|uniref:Sterol regulatory element-binding protein cleavage-activating protein n=1 Tax=Ophiocordyceps australis TaxID=1399860 RepID=A0A2C5ZUL7_9HYPO|nr:hypothetical protein CDD82_7564 [Ophiocordyceps australis]
MIWYLLYPLRGTTEPPVLPPSHLLHRALSHYGRCAARHVVATLLVSAAVATMLLYPIPFLFTSDFTNGASNLPHHVWTAARPLPYDAAAKPKIIMRSVWFHASYMKALNVDLLTAALDVQDDLLGTTKNFSPARAHKHALAPHHAKPGNASLTLAQRDALHVANGLTDEAWFFHSPLLYWGCSNDRILADTDILATVNNKKNQSTSANVTLRHSIVFSGKRFEERRLLAADALVITLLHLGNSPVGREWEKRARQLPTRAAKLWDVYPPDGHVTTSQLYEFQFRPISVQDITSLALAYLMTIVYLLVSLSKLRAVKSKFGLIVTIVTQIVFSIMSSFTVCAVFKIDLSHIPRAAYPLVVLSMSLENIIRLINAVILTPFEDSVSNRIGQAFGETAPTAFASTVQNCFLLVFLSRLVSSGVSEFCVFTAVAIVFDFFYLSTFFLAVLSLDVRRMELGDALAKSAMRHNRDRGNRGQSPSWWHQLIHENVAMSTRIAGTIIMLGFVLIAQWHFLADEGLLRKLLRLYRICDATMPSGLPRTTLLEDIHQARSPMSWLRMQDHETAREVINIIKPSAYSYVARVFDPLVLVLKDADRTPHTNERALLPAVYDFINHELTRFAVIVIVIIASLRLLTNYLLWGEDEQSLPDQHDAEKAPIMSVKSLPGHRMDIVVMATSANGDIVTASIDSTLRVWSIRGIGNSYLISKGNETAASLFPVGTLAIDDTSTWVAVQTRPKGQTLGKVTMWNLRDHFWSPSVHSNSCRERPTAFFFDPSASRAEPRAIIVNQDGTLTEVSAGTLPERGPLAVFPPELKCARVVAIKEDDEFASQSVIMAVSKQGAVHLATRSHGHWKPRRLALEGLGISNTHSIEVLPAIELFIVSAKNCVYLIGAQDGSVLHTIKTTDKLLRPLRCAYTSHGASMPGTIGLASFSLAYVEAGSKDCVLQTILPPENCDAIYLRAPSDASGSDWCTWDSAVEKWKRVTNPGSWDIISDGTAVGIRCRQPTMAAQQEAASSGLRNRHAKRSRETDVFGCWQVWTATPAGRCDADDTQRLVKEGEEDKHLWISSLGPEGRVGINSVGFVFGNLVKLVVIGGPAKLADNLDEVNTGSRRRKPGSASRARVAV